MYCGYVVTLNNLRKHSNANRLEMRKYLDVM